MGRGQERWHTGTRLDTPLGQAAGQTEIPTTTCSFSIDGVLKKGSLFRKNGSVVRRRVRRWNGAPCGHSPLTTLSRSIEQNWFIRHPSDAVDCKLHPSRVSSAYEWVAECTWPPLDERRKQYFCPSSRLVSVRKPDSLLRPVTDACVFIVVAKSLHSLSLERGT